MWEKPIRNYEKIQFAELRQTVESRYNELADELSDCYYNCWKHGLAKPFYGYNVQATLEDSKLLFDKLHGLIFHKLEVALCVEAEKPSNQDKPYQEKFRKHIEIRDTLGNIIDTKKDRSLRHIDQLRQEGIELTF